MQFYINFELIFSCVTHLLRNLNGNSPFPVDIDGYTPLHYAASHGHKMAVQIVNTCHNKILHIFKFLLKGKGKVSEITEPGLGKDLLLP